MGTTCALLILTASIGVDFPCFCPQYEYFGTMGKCYDGPLCSSGSSDCWREDTFTAAMECATTAPFDDCDCVARVIEAPTADARPIEKPIKLEDAKAFKNQKEVFATYAILADDKMMKIKIQQLLIQYPHKPAFLAWAAVEVDKFPSGTTPIDMHRIHCARNLGLNQYQATDNPRVLRGKLGISPQPEFLILVSQDVPCSNP